jgi:hypothetical protein
MAGTLIRILPKTDFVLSSVGATVVELPQSMFDTTIFTTMNIVARIHAKSASGTGTQTLNVLFKNLAPSIDDIAAEFVGSTVGTASFTISGGTTGVQTPQIVACTGALSYKMRLVLSASQTTAGTAFTFSLSVDGLGRE